MNIVPCAYTAVTIRTFPLKRPEHCLLVSESDCGRASEQKPKSSKTITNLFFSCCYCSYCPPEVLGM